MFAEFLTCFERVEKQEYNEFLEYIPLAYKYGKISADMAKAILQTQMDTEFYNSMIGRSINTRPGDYTSLCKFHTPETYVERQSLQDGPAVRSYVEKCKPIYLSWCHDLIQKSDIIFECFRDRLTLFYINRRPIDIIYEWIRKDFGNRVGTDPTEMQYLIDFDGQQVPELAFGWEQEYLDMNAVERIIRMIHTSFGRNLEKLLSTPNSSQVIVVNFEDLVTETETTISGISKILQLKRLRSMDATLVREQCPRVLGDEEYEKRRAEICGKVSDRSLGYLSELDEFYNNIRALSGMGTVN
ncbi:hypothetical protein N9V84_05730 [Verrucomicrobiales bacterium]|nr:hypothetical protein [Verrucomicrobiales bacterium]